MVDSLLCSESERFDDLDAVVRFSRVVLSSEFSCYFAEV